MLNIPLLREQTPGCHKVIHFNNAGSSLMPRPVFEAQINYLHLELSQGGYEAKDTQEEAIEQIYSQAAQLIKAQPHEIALVENATVAWQLAFASIQFKPGDRILTAQASYHSNYLNLLLARERHGVEIEVIPNDGYGQVSVEALANLLDDRVKLIAITHVPTNGGLVNPAAAIGQLAQQSQALYLLDACQSIGQLPIDVTAIGCDILSTTGRKWLRGPRGTGFLYINQHRLTELQPPFIDLHSAELINRNQYQLRTDARRYENWEYNYAALMGFGVAIQYAMDVGVENTWPRIQVLATALREALHQMPGVTVYDLGQEQGGIVTFASETKSATEIKAELSVHNINTSTSSPQSTLLDGEARSLPTLVRASVHYYNTEEEIAKFCDILRQII